MIWFSFDGAQVNEVDEHPWVFPVVVPFEFEAYPEAKALNADEVRALHKRYGSFYRVAEEIGSSEGFARQTAALAQQVAARQRRKKKT